MLDIPHYIKKIMVNFPKLTFEHKYNGLDLQCTLMPHALSPLWAPIRLSGWLYFLLPLVVLTVHPVLMFLLVSFTVPFRERTSTFRVQISLLGALTFPRQWIVTQHPPVFRIPQLESTRYLFTSFVCSCHGFLRWPQHPGTGFWHELLCSTLSPVLWLDDCIREQTCVNESDYKRPAQNNDTARYRHAHKRWR